MTGQAESQRVGRMCSYGDYEQGESTSRGEMLVMYIW